MRFESDGTVLLVVHVYRVENEHDKEESIRIYIQQATQ